ncbi:MAG: hypothetical protein WDW36_008049 [Sanguina aurantia]
MHQLSPISLLKALTLLSTMHVNGHKHAGSLPSSTTIPANRAALARGSEESAAGSSSSSSSSTISSSSTTTRSSGDSSGSDGSNDDGGTLSKSGAQGSSPDTASRTRSSGSSSDLGAHPLAGPGGGSDGAGGKAQSRAQHSSGSEPSHQQQGAGGGHHTHPSHPDAPSSAAAALAVDQQLLMSELQKMMATPGQQQPQQQPQQQQQQQRSRSLTDRLADHLVPHAHAFLPKQLHATALPHRNPPSDLTPSTVRLRPSLWQQPVSDSPTSLSRPAHTWVHAAALSLMRLNSPHPALLSALSARATALVEQTQRSYPAAHIRLTVEDPGLSPSLSLSLITPPLAAVPLPPAPEPTSACGPPDAQPSLRDLVTLLPPSLPMDVARRGTGAMIDSRQMGTLAFAFSRLNHLDPGFFLAYATANSAEWAARSRSPTLLAATALAISSVLQPPGGVGAGAGGSGGAEVERAGGGPLGRERIHRVGGGGDSAASQQAAAHRTLFRDILAAARRKVSLQQ